MTTITILNYKQCRIESDDKSLIYKLKQHLSFVQPGFEYTPAHINYNWNGVITLISDKRNEFNYPLLTRVKDFLKNNNCDYTINDKRKVIVKNVELDISKKLKELKLIPRDYQIEAAEKACSTEYGIIRLCTGSGKTLVSALITAKLNKPTLILVIGLDLLDQFHKLYSSIFPNETIGRIGGGECIIGDKINIATIWTVARALKVSKKEMKFDEDIQDEKFEESNGSKIIEMLDKCEAFQLDECHIAGTASIKNLYKHLKNIHSFIGLSGTPFRTNEVDLEIISILGEKLIDISATYLIERKVLPQPIIKFIAVPNLSVFGKTYHEVYKQYIVENDIRNTMILNQCKALLEKKYCILVLFKTIAHGNILFELFKEHGIRCELLSGKDSLEKRNETIKKLNDNEIDIIIASTIYDIGVDVPKLSSLVLAGSGKSYVKCLQRIGRLTRNYPGKTNVAIVDFYDNIRYLKNHSKERLETYQKEEGFKIIIPPIMK